MDVSTGLSVCPSALPHACPQLPQTATPRAGPRHVLSSRASPHASPRPCPCPRRDSLTCPARRREPGGCPKVGPGHAAAVYSETAGWAREAGTRRSQPWSSRASGLRNGHGRPLSRGLKPPLPSPRTDRSPTPRRMMGGSQEASRAALRLRTGPCVRGDDGHTAPGIRPSQPRQQPGLQDPECPVWCGALSATVMTEGAGPRAAADRTGSQTGPGHGAHSESLRGQALDRAWAECPRHEPPPQRALAGGAHSEDPAGV